MPLKCETNILQNRMEFADFIQIAKQENVRSYLEIGSKHGGSMWNMANALPKGSRVVSVELPHGDQSFKVNLPNLQACMAELKNRGYDATLIIGDSTDPAVIEQAKALAPFDLCFIDANHTYPYVTKDFANYGPMARIVAFHDIGFYRKEGMPPHKMPIDVPRLWGEIKTAVNDQVRPSQNMRFHELRRDPQDNGIGILWQS